jgi:hypothetical protein
MSCTQDKLLLGSSLCKQVSEYIHNSGINIDHIIFKGDIDLNNIKSKLKSNNKSYKQIFFISGNNLYPSKIHNIKKESHVCLKPFNLENCIDTYKNLVKILETFTDHLIFIEPPPRATTMKFTRCKFFDDECKNRFRIVKNNLSSNKIYIGVLTCSTILGFLGQTGFEGLLSTDNIHLSKKALQIIAQQVTQNYNS